MIKLNLLPPEEKINIASQEAFRKILIWGFASLILVLIFLALLSSIWLYLLIEFRSVQSILSELENNPQNETFKKIKTEIDGINQKLKYFDQLQREEIKQSFYIEELIQLANQNIKFKHIWTDSNKFVLEGVAANRQSLLNLKEDLTSSSSFKNINTPLSNFLKQYNIDFSFSFEIKKQ